MTENTPTSEVECSIPGEHDSHSMIAWYGGQKFGMICGGKPEAGDSFAMPMSETDRQRKAHELTAEMLDWVEGRKSNNNMYMQMEADPQHRQETLLRIAQADAMEVQKLSAAIQALAALDRRPT